MRVEHVTRTFLLGVPVDIIPREELRPIVQRMIDRQQVLQIVFLRWWDVIRSKYSAKFRSVVSNAALIVPMSLGIRVGVRFLRAGAPVRYTPFEFVARLLTILQDLQCSIYLLGLNRPLIEMVSHNIAETYPNIRVVGCYSGYFSGKMEENISIAIKKAAPHLLLTGTGVPGQDRWLFQQRKKLNPGLHLWSSEVLEILAGKRTRVAKRWIRLGLDFVPGLFRRPWRVYRFFVYLWYLILLIFYRLADRR